MTVHYPHAQEEYETRPLKSTSTAALCPYVQATSDAASDVLEHRQDMDACFAGDSMDGIYAALERHGSSWAEATLKQLQA